MIFIRTGTEKTDSDRETHSPHTFCNSVHSGGCPLISLDVFGHLWDILKIYKQHYFALVKQKKDPPAWLFYPRAATNYYFLQQLNC